MNVTVDSVGSTNPKLFSISFIAVSKVNGITSSFISNSGVII